MDKRGLISFVAEAVAARWQCDAGAFFRGENSFFVREGCALDMLTFGAGLCARGDADMMALMRERFPKKSARFVMEPACLRVIDAALRERGYFLSGENDRYLRIGGRVRIPAPEGYEYRLYEGDAMEQVWAYAGFGNALNYKDDVIALCAFAPGEDAPVAMTAADDRMGDLWQIGVDTLPAHRRRGLAAYLTAALADAIEARGKTPYYTTWMPNLASANVALRAGFLPVWVEYEAIPLADAVERE